MTRAFVGRDRISIFTDSSADGTLEPDFSTALVTGLPCEITNVAGQEAYRGRQLEPLTEYVIETRHRSDVTHKMKVTATAGLHNGKSMFIEAVQSVQFNRGQPPMLLIMCNRVPA